MVIYEGPEHSQPTTASCMIHRRSPRIELWHFYQDFDQSCGGFRQSSQIARMSGILEFPTDLGQFGDRIPSCMSWDARDAFLECSGGVKRASSLILWKLPIRYSQMFLQFRTLRCSRISPKKTNRWNWIFLNVLERSRLDPNDAFGMKEIHRHMLRRLSEENFICSLPLPDIQLKISTLIYIAVIFLIRPK